MVDVCLADLQAHGWVATIGLGFLIPLGILAAKLVKDTTAWRILFWAHVGLQVDACMCVCV